MEGPSTSSRLARIATSPLGVIALVALALAEATVFPGPTEAMLVALTLGRRERAAWFATVATMASVVGGVIGYLLGARYYGALVEPLLATYGLGAQVDAARSFYSANVLAALVTSGYTPVPYLLYTAIAGATHVPLPLFVLGSLVGRALKYAPITALAYLLGPGVHRALRRWGPIAGVVVVGLLAIYLLLT